ncbi:hypothetical protein FXN63_15125 [Pigmentiphaga aceris]|uniref:Cellulose biosynthesis protein BcsR n=1 Tax=Pigmentiphaga aceris TaxID=1940612 RepID=A0A5C0B2Q0_9BURK|nr:cellulose biosynthesis protein BcsP [Pigmentiphaga aceris]QEI07021.1 hypothetical protein FXN63_15125 [Pigmentiphaga aceris]
MKDSDDIANLLKQFGGRPDEYYEIGRASEAKDSQARWPLLSSIEATQGEHHPPVQPHMPTNAAQSLPGSLRGRVTPPAGAHAAGESRAEQRGDARLDPRVEPRFAPPAPAAEQAPAPVAPARSAPQAQFVPPRPRGHIVPPTRPAGSAAGLAGMRQGLPEPTPAQPEPLVQASRPVSAPLAGLASTGHVSAGHASPGHVSPGHASTRHASGHVSGSMPGPAPTSPAPTTLASPPMLRNAPPAPAELTPLQAIFQRLSQPQPTPDPATTRDKSASLLQRLSRL